MEDPVEAFKVWSCGFSPELGRIVTQCPTLGGQMVSPVDVIEGVVNDLERMHSAGLLPDEVVPDTGRILPVMRTLLAELHSGDLTALARHFDWALRWRILEGQMAEQGLPLESDEIALMNQLYSHADKEVGLFWPFQECGFAEQMVTQAHVERMQTEGPDNTRAYTRNRILEKFGESVRSCDWSRLVLEVPRDAGLGHAGRVTLRLDDPVRFTKAETGALIESASSVVDLCRALGAAGERLEAGGRIPALLTAGLAGVAALPSFDEDDFHWGSWWHNDG